MGGRGAGGAGGPEPLREAWASLVPNSLDVCVPVLVHGVFDVFRSLAVSCKVQNETKQCQLMNIYEWFSILQSNLHYVRANRAMLLRKPSELFMQLSHAPADTVRANRAMLRRKPPEQRLASISSYSSDSDSKATAEARGGLMRTSWAWQVVGDSRAGFSRLASVAILRAKDLRGRSKVNNYFIKFSHSFLFKSQT